MSEYTLFGQTIEFNKAADNFYFISKASELAAINAVGDFRTFYWNCGDIAEVLDKYMSAVYTFTKKWAVDNLYDTLLDLKIYDISRERFEDECWDLSAVEPYYDCIADKYNEIVGNLASAKEYRTERRATRGRLVGGGFGLGGAVKGIVTAGAINAVAGAGHGAVNTIGNLGSSIAASSSKKALYNNENTLDILEDGVRECIQNIHLYYISFINEYKESEGLDKWFDTEAYNLERARTLLSNSAKVPEKEKELLEKAFFACPCDANVLAMIFLNYEEERKNIFKLVKKYKLNINICYETVLGNMFASMNEQTSLEEYLDIKARMNSFIEEFEVEDSYTFDDFEQSWLKIMTQKYNTASVKKVERIVEDFKAFDALIKNKKTVAYYRKMWEVASEYDLDFSDEEKIVILQAVIDSAKKDINIGYEDVIKRAQTVADTLGIDGDKIILDYEYDVLSELAQQYETYPVGKANELVEKIKTCNVSDLVKKEVVYDFDIWELAGIYDVEFEQTEIANIFYAAYQELKKTTSYEELKTVFDRMAQELGILNADGEIPVDVKEYLFDYLSDLDEEEDRYREEAGTVASASTSTITNNAEEIIKATGITFMTFALTYRTADLRTKASELKYCQMRVGEAPIIIYDDCSFLGTPGTGGFCLTNQRLIAKQTSCGSFELDIASVNSFAKKGILSSRILVNTRNDVKELDVEKLSELGKFADCLNQILKAIPEQSGQTGSATKAVEKKHINNCKKCIDDNPLLVEYFSMSEKAEKINSIMRGVNNGTLQVSNISLSTKRVDTHIDKDGNISGDIKNTVCRLLAEDHDKLKAITILKNATGLSLAEAKARVEQIEANDLAQYMQNKKKSETKLVSEEEYLNKKLKELLEEGKKVEAIRVLKDETGINTVEAKQRLEGMYPQLMEKAEEVVDIVTIEETDVISVTDSNNVFETEELIQEVKTKIEIKDNAVDLTEIEKEVTLNKVKFDSGYTSTEVISMLAKKYDISTSVYLLGGTRGFEKKIDKAKNYFAPFTPSEKPLLLRDTTLLGSCKEGFVLTNKMFYLKGMGEEKTSTPICDISKVYSKKGNAFRYIYISTDKGDLWLESFLKNTSDEKMRSNVDFWCDVFGYLKQQLTLVNEQNLDANALKKAVENKEVWKCKCGNSNTTKFCTNCGCKKEDVIVWTCSCGSVNKGNFCPECGSPKQ